jgi:hypothetical protein
VLIKNLGAQFLQSNAQKTHSRAVAEAIRFNCTRSDSMKTTLLLTDEAETTRLMLEDLAFDELALRHTEARGLQLRSVGTPMFRVRRTRHCT